MLKDYDSIHDNINDIIYDDTYDNNEGIYDSTNSFNRNDDYFFSGMKTYYNNRPQNHCNNCNNGYQNYYNNRPQNYCDYKYQNYYSNRPKNCCNNGHHNCCYNKCPSCMPLCPSFPIPPMTTLNLRGMQVELNTDEAIAIEPNANVIFDNIVKSFSNYIDYDILTGIFTIAKPGTYKISWTLSTDGAGSATSITFGIYSNDFNEGSITAVVNAGLITGNVLINVTTIPKTFSLINKTNDDVYLIDSYFKGNIVISEVI